MVFLVLFCFLFFLFCCFFKFDYSSFIQGRHHTLLSYGNISIIYILLIFFVVANLTKYDQLSWSGKRKLAEGIGFLFFLPHRSGLSCPSQVLDEKGKQKTREIPSKSEREEFCLHLPPPRLLSPLLCLLFHFTGLSSALPSLAPKLNINLTALGQSDPLGTCLREVRHPTNTAVF